MTGAVTSQYTRSITDVRSDGFSEQTVFASGPTTTSEWQCDDGALVDLQPSAAASATFQSSSGMSMNFKTIETSGVTVPDNLGPGATWNQELTLEGTTTISGQDAKARNVMKMDCTGSNSESVTVPAGTFNAVRADCKIDSKITVTMSGVEVPTDVSTTSTMWYAPDVGLVKIAEVISGSDSVTIELTSYKIP